MKYHGHEIRVVREDMGYDDPRLNKQYEVWKEGEHIDTAWSLDSAKDFIDSGYDQDKL